MKILAFAVGLITTSFASAATISYAWSNDRALVGVSPGTAAAGDGSIVELGYYSMATVTNLFAGEWRAFGTTHVGDGVPNSLTNFFFAVSVLDTDVAGPNVIGIPLAIRFYDGSSLATSTRFNAVSDPAWTVPSTAPGPGSIKIAIEKSVTQESQGGSFFIHEPILHFSTVPEPSSALLLALGALSFFSRRRRLKSVPSIDLD